MTELRTETPQVIEGLRKKAQQARDVSNAMSQRGRWQMRVPVDQDTDSDCIVHDLADLAEQAADLLAQLTRAEALEPALTYLRRAVDEALEQSGFRVLGDDDSERDANRVDLLFDALKIEAAPSPAEAGETPIEQVRFEIREDARLFQAGVACGKQLAEARETPREIHCDGYGHVWNGVIGQAGQPGQLCDCGQQKWEARETPTCQTCRHWLPEDRGQDFRAQCGMGVSGATPEKASHHPYPITRRDFGCSLHVPSAQEPRP